MIVPRIWTGEQLLGNEANIYKLANGCCRTSYAALWHDAKLGVISAHAECPLLANWDKLAYADEVFLSAGDPNRPCRQRQHARSSLLIRSKRASP